MWRRAVVDLTALLDVILIMLFLVLTNATAGVEDAQAAAARTEAAAAQVQAQNEALQGENERLTREVDGLHFLDAHMHMVNIFMERDADGSRTVCVESEAGARRFPLNWDNADAVKGALDAELARVCGNGADEEQLYLLLLRYDRNAIYQADYVLLRDALMRRKNLGGNIYSAEYDIMEENKDG